MKRMFTVLLALLSIVKMSDLTAQCGACPTEPTGLYLIADNLMPIPGDEVCYTLFADQFQNVVSMQFSITFSSSSLRFTSENTNLSGLADFGPFNQTLPPGSNTYSVLWFDQNGVANCLPNNVALIEVCFEVIGNPGQEIKTEIGDPSLFSVIEIGYVDTTMVSSICPNVSTTPRIDTTLTSVPNLVLSSCAGGPEIFSNEICGTPTSLREGKVKLDLFCGTAPYSLTIDGTRNIDNITDGFAEVDMLAAGLHIFRITDATGQMSQPIQVTVDVANNINIVESVRQPRCFAETTARGSIELDITGGTPFADGTYSYDWGGINFGRDVSPMLNRIGNGDYNVTIRDSLGCAEVASFSLNTIEIDVIPTASPSRCDGVNTGQVTLIASGGVSTNGNGYRFRLEGVANDSTRVFRNGSSPNNQHSIFNLPAGIYEIWAEDDDVPSGACDPNPVSFTIGNVVAVSVVVAPDPAMGMCPTGEQSIEFTVSNTDPSGATTFNYQIWSVVNGMRALQVSNANGEMLGIFLECLPFGDYEIDVQDTDGCAIMAQPFTVDGCDLNIEPPFFIEPDCVDINGGSIPLVISGGTMPFSILWSNGETTQTISNLSPGTYSVTVTDAMMCIDSLKDIVLNVPEMITVDLTDTGIMCPGGTASITATPQGGFDPYTYEWDPDPSGTTTATLNGAIAGIYNVTVTDDDGCPAMGTITIEEPTPPISSLTSPVPPICEGDPSGVINISIAINSAFPGPFSFESSSGEIGVSSLTFSPTNLLSGQQWILYSTQAGCTFDTIFFDVPEGPSLEIDSANSNFGLIECFGEETFVSLVGLGGVNIDFVWPDPINITGAVASVPAGQYEITLTAGTCMSIETINIIQPDSFGVVIDLNLSSLPLCEGDLGNLVSSRVGGTDPVTYVWQDENGDVVGNDIALTDVAAGMYTLMAIDANMCTSSDMIDLMVASPVEGFLGDIIQPFCFGDVGQVFIDSAQGGRSPYRYQLDTNAAIEITDTSSAQSGDHTITIFDRNGCSWDTMFTIVTPDEVSITLSGDTEIELGRDGELTANIVSPVAIDTVIWTSSGVDSIVCLTNDCSRINIQPVNDGTYTATVINVDGCVATATIDVNVIRSQNIYVPNIFSPNSALNARNRVFQIYPGSGVSAINYLRIYDRWGNLVHEEFDLPIRNDGLGTGSWNGTMRNGNIDSDPPLASGVYVYVYQVRFLGDTEPEIRKGDVTLIR